jgi:hypothetical protein
MRGGDETLGGDDRLGIAGQRRRRRKQGGRRKSMPKGAMPIAAYTRYYKPSLEHGRRVVFGYFDEEGDKKIHISKSLPPGPFDGGCSIIYVSFDVEAGKILSIACDGVA